jgi:hypothetical protein
MSPFGHKDFPASFRFASVAHAVTCTVRVMYGGASEGVYTVLWLFFLYGEEDSRRLTARWGAVSYTYMKLPTILKKRRNNRMADTIRARVRSGRLELLETLNLPEGTEVTVTIETTAPDADREAFRRSAGGWKDTVDAEALIKNIYDSRVVSTRPVPEL